MRYDREEYIALMLHEDGARPMLVEIFGLLAGLSYEWRSQGATEDEISLRAFDLDFVESHDCGGNCGIINAMKPVTLEETEDYIISRDSIGRKNKLFKNVASIPLPLENPVKNMDDWLKLKHMFIYDEGRVDNDMIEKAKKAQNEGALITAWIPGGYHLPRDLMGDEEACVCYYDDPELMADIIGTVTDTAIKVLSRATEKITIDRILTGEDLAGKSGPLVGPKQVRDFIAPYYRAVWDLASSRGTKLFAQDSDGDTRPVINDFLNAGVNLMYPLEPAAGMDIVKLRETYGKRLAFTGGIDKHVLRESRAAIRNELEYKMQPHMRTGTAFGLDHRITNGTPIENYRYYIKTAKEILY